MYNTVKCNCKDCKFNTNGNYCTLTNIVIDKKGNCLYATKEEKEK